MNATLHPLARHALPLPDRLTKDPEEGPRLLTRPDLRRPRDRRHLQLPDPEDAFYAVIALIALGTLAWVFASQAEFAAHWERFESLVRQVVGS